MAVRLRRVAVLGSTGSIGRATLDVIGRMPDRFRVHALAARSSTRTLYAQVARHAPNRVILTDLAACRRARAVLGNRVRVEWGPGPLIETARSRAVDILVMAMSGTAGLLPLLAAIERGKHVAIATKEILVGYGDHVMRLARRHAARVLPIDSELAAIHQCLAGRPLADVRRVILTASGGPFWRRALPARPELGRVLDHPTWRMGAKITVDSATLMNKGLELIEAARLFGLAPGQVDAVIHPGSLVHGAVEFRDGSLIAQLARPDMRLPIQYCLCFPDRSPSPVRPLGLADVGRLEFHPLPPGRFPCFDLARRALETGGGMPCVLNAANQVAVDAFLRGSVAFSRIPGIIGSTLTAYLERRPGPGVRSSVRTVLRLEEWATRRAQELAEEGGHRARGASR